MSLAKQCDRCKAFFCMEEAGAGSVTGVLPTTDMHMVTYDLCPDCYKDFLVFLYTKKVGDAAGNAALSVQKMKNAIDEHCFKTSCELCPLTGSSVECDSYDPETVKRNYNILVGKKDDGGGAKNE